MTIIIEFKNLERKKVSGNNIAIVNDETFMNIGVDGEIKFIISKDVVAFIEYIKE